MKSLGILSAAVLCLALQIETVFAQESEIRVGLEVSRLTLFAVPNPSARLQGLLSGRLHIAMVLGPDEITLVESAGHAMFVQPDTSMIVLAFNLAKPSPLHDIRVRRALNHAVNKQAIVDGLLAGQSRVSTQTASAVAFGFDPELEAYEYDPELAQTLLADWISGRLQDDRRSAQRDVFVRWAGLSAGRGRFSACGSRRRVEGNSRA